MRWRASVAAVSLRSSRLRGKLPPTMIGALDLKKGILCNTAIWETNSLMSKILGSPRPRVPAHQQRGLVCGKLVPLCGRGLEIMASRTSLIFADVNTELECVRAVQNSRSFKVRTTAGAQESNASDSA